MERDGRCLRAILNEDPPYWADIQPPLMLISNTGREPWRVKSVSSEISNAYAIEYTTSLDLVDY